MLKQNQKTPLLFYIISALSFLIIAVVFLYFSINNSGRLTYRFLGVIGGVYLLIGLALFIVRKAPPFLTNILLLVTFMNFGYVALEGTMYLVSAFSRDSRNINLFNRPCSEFDKVRGYRWAGDSCRVVRVVKGTVAYDQEFNINNQGWVSHYDYFFKKKALDVKRYLVFGDSFTAAIFLEKNWPQRVQQLLSSSKIKYPYEIYSFGVDGGGLSNWHETFFKEIINNYEFDGIVIAAYLDSLYRDFAIMHMTEVSVKFKRFKSIPKDKDDFKKNYMNTMSGNYQVLAKDDVDRKIKKYTKAIVLFKPFSLYVVNLFTRFRDGITMRKNEEGHTGFTKQQLPEVQMDKLKQMVDWCKKNNKEVIFASIPSLSGLLEAKKEVYYEEIKSIAEEFDVLYFDGFKAFGNLSSEEIKGHWFKLDGHWNQKGSDRFARYFAQYIQKE